MRKPTVATLALLVVTAIWGSTFFIIKDAVSKIDPIDFLAVRFAVGAAIPAFVFWRRLSRLTATQWQIGLALGCLYGLAQIVQTVGLQTTAASVSGFITGTYVVLTPIIMWIAFKARLNVRTWVAVALALAGLAVLSLTGLGNGGVGEALTLVGAALYAVHIVLLDRWSRSMDAMSLAIVQLIGVALTTGFLGLPGGYHVPADPGVWGAIVYTAIMAGIVTMLLQTWAQRHITPTRVALLMTFEPVFASAFAVGFGGEAVTIRLVAGGALILLATLIGIRGGQADAVNDTISIPGRDDADPPPRAG
ncbi:DMT family transporter [Tessaracoccus sp. MC1679]|uniref:DMT family transporter n=1 Tax=unclassified Tessaracoccus TaxID=2635419 RepID=UPI0015FF01E0|nr:MULTISPECIES: DMT family transporter [unclassified Tessaracoccus]MBB1513157.1 DMT family transporter [Tessaracoccus sp. MC1627]MBB1513510.1 DMT family transporter [Tessaracoccus sp. MC1627]MBB1517158.1 DMT family transporter [Tessaracoccus sp. MC1679]